jgi:hypothetical protein
VTSVTMSDDQSFLSQKDIQGNESLDEGSLPPI